ncbi:MAG: hypothetical protein M3R52_10565 [Acidobacteriota bacterium]|nr:hypothetical protein [Acidobacteriota bacterium]
MKAVVLVSEERDLGVPLAGGFTGVAASALKLIDAAPDEGAFERNDALGRRCVRVLNGASFTPKAFNNLARRNTPG